MTEPLQSDHSVEEVDSAVQPASGEGAGQRVYGIGARVLRWFDTWAEDSSQDPAPPQMRGDRRHVDWVRVLPFLAMHLACGFIWIVGWSWFAVGVAVALYAIRMFAITAFYHRFFSHRTFRTWRWCQFLFAFAGATAVQRGPLWWAAHHRLHHQRSDKPGDAHSPRVHGFWWSHVGWFLDRGNFRTHTKLIGDFVKFPELRWLDRYDMAAPTILALALWGAGSALEAWAPGLGTNGPQLFVWGFLVSTIVLYHATFSINSLAHVWGQRRHTTPDDSRNNLFLALLTFGEGWHNNHHLYPRSARQGFLWWQLDPSYYVLKLMSWCGLVWDLKPVPARLRGTGVGRGISMPAEESVP